MKGRSKRTLQRETERIGHKQARQAERQAELGGRVKTVRGEHWSANLEQPSLPDEPARYPKKKTKKRAKKERCPVNGKHECLEEERKVESSWYNSKMVLRRFKMCVHCGKEWYYHERPSGYSFAWNKKHRRTGWRPVRS